jgi:hypothetical protein
MKNISFLIVSSFILYGCKKIDYGTEAIKSAFLTTAAPSVFSFEGTMASCNSSIDLSGGNYTYGFCYSLTRNPVIPGLATGAGNYAAGSFSAMLTNIEYGKTYYIRAFVTNGFATSYSNMDSFAVPLFIHTDTVKNISARSFDVHIYTLPAIADSITERGVCFDTLAKPDITDLKNISAVTDTGKILLHVNDTLRPGKTYFLRSYFITNGRPVYGNEVNFKTAGYKGSYGYIVFDKGDTTNGWRYIEAALDTITAANAKWGCSGTDVPGTLLTVGTGYENSNAIAAPCSDTLAAANICINLKLKNASDWYLPSVDELNALYELKISGVITKTYLLFSSSQATANDCYVVDFSSGQQQQIIKSSSAALIWPVRRY